MTAIFKNDGLDAWSALHNAIAAAVGGELNGAIVQPLRIAERADWDTSNRFLNLYREQRIVNQCPTWNSIYIPNTGINVPDEYQAFLDQLNSKVITDSGIADPDELKRLDGERQSAQDKLQKNEYFINHEWDRYVANNRGKPPLSRAQWESDFGFSANRLNLQRQVDSILAAYMREVNTAGGDLLEVGRALGALSDTRQRLPLPQDEDDATLPSDSWQYWYRAGLADNIDEFLRTSNVVEINLTDVSTRTTNFHERWGGSFNVSWFSAFGVGGSVSNETIKEHSETDTSSIKIHFENIQSFPVERGQWFKAGVVSRFRDKMPKGFWGASGRLNLIPAAVTLVRGVVIEVNTTTTVTDYFFSKRTTGGSAGFSIGPWRIGGGASKTSIEETYSLEKTGSGFLIKDNSNRAQIIAVTSIRNADLLSSPSPMSPLYLELNEAEAREGRLLLEESRRDSSNSVEAFGI